MGSRTFSLACVAAALGCGLGCARPAANTSDGLQKNMTYTNITPEQAKKLVDSEGYVYLDVRTVPEFVAGHAPASLNIPVLEINPATGGRDMNEKFVGIVEAAIPRDAKIVVGCKTGGRSATACEMLARAGYKNLRNIDGGFAGVTDPSGHVVKEGWFTMGYPVERGDGGEKSYETLKNRKP